jgi:Na+/H+-dicarboxylate symporter
MIDRLDVLKLESLERLSERIQSLVRTRLWAKVLVAMAGGVAAGFVIGPEVALLPAGWTRPVIEWLAFPGMLFLAMVQMIVVPLVFASVVRGLTASESIEQLKRMGSRAFAFFGVTTAVAVVLGMGIAMLIRPGGYVEAESLRATLTVSSTSVDAATLPSLDEIPDVLTGLVPRNPLASIVGGEMLQIITFALLTGIALLSMPAERSAPLYDLLGSLQDVCMTVVGWAMRLAPIAVFGLMAQLTATVGVETLLGMGVYVLTVLAGLAALMLLYLLLAAVFGGCGPRRFIASTRELLLLAFSTSSSAAVMPLSIATVESLGVRESTARLLIPLGATINMTGTAVYQGAATVFLAQIFGVDLGPAQLGLVVVTAVAASIGAPATPGVGMAILATVLARVGIPPEGVVLLIGVDRLLDMSRTSVNVAGDVVACLVLDRVASEPPPVEHEGEVRSPVRAAGETALS